MNLSERDHELLVIDQTLAAGGLLVVEGVAGIGKTALLGAVTERAIAAGRRPLQARGALLERDYGYGIARQLFDPLLRGGDQAGVLQGTASGASDVLGGTGHPTDRGEVSSFRTLRGLTALAVNLAEQMPLAIIIDDAQWGDLPSLRFAGFLARRLDGPDIVLVVAIRSGEQNAPQELLDDLRDAPGARQLTPRPLSSTALADLVREASPDVADEVLLRCHEATGGNPLLVQEILRGLAGGDDPVEAAVRGIARGVHRRIERAHARGLDVARAVAILGPDATLARVAALCGLDPVSAGQAASALAGADVLLSATPYSFVHPLVAEAVLTMLDDGERVRLRHRCAKALLAEDLPIERVAAQLIAVPGTGDGEVAAVLRAAASTALTRGAARSAVSLLTRALDEPPPMGDRVSVLRELSTAERLAGDAACVDHARAALALSAQPELRALARRELARCEFDLSRYTDAVSTLTAALREAPDDLAVEARDAVRVDLMTAAILSSAVDANELVGDISRGVAPEDRGVTIAAEISAVAMRLTAEEPIANFIGDLERLLLEAPPSPDRLDVHTTMWWGMCMLERFAALEAQLDAVERSGPGWMRRQFTINFARAHLEQRLGRLDDAIASHASNLEFGEHDRSGALLISGGLATALLQRGDVDRAVDIVDAMEVPAGRDEGHLVQVHWGRGRVLAAVGRDREAIEAFTIGWKIQDSFRNTVGLVWEAGGAERIALLARLGRDEEALAAAQSSLRAARTRGLVGLQGISLRTLGLLEHDGHLLAEAADMLDRTPMRLERALAHLAHGEHLRRTGQRLAAQDALRRAADLGHACGARPLTARARRELVLAGARPRRDAITGRDALTDAEARVARLVAAGRTNRDVAGELFITTKTVEGHLARIFRKLDITRRQQLQAAFGCGPDLADQTATPVAE